MPVPKRPGLAERRRRRAGLATASTSSELPARRDAFARRVLARRAARDVAPPRASRARPAMHDAGFDHRDLHAGNVLVGPGPPTVHLTDLHRGDGRSGGGRGAAAALARLLHSPAGRRRRPRPRRLRRAARTGPRRSRARPDAARGRAAAEPRASAASSRARVYTLDVGRGPRRAPSRPPGRADRPRAPRARRARSRRATRAWPSGTPRPRHAPRRRRRQGARAGAALGRLRAALAPGRLSRGVRERAPPRGPRRRDGAAARVRPPRRARVHALRGPLRAPAPRPPRARGVFRRARAARARPRSSRASADAGSPTSTAWASTTAT